MELCRYHQAGDRDQLQILWLHIPPQGCVEVHHEHTMVDRRRCYRETFSHPADPVNELLPLLYARSSTSGAYVEVDRVGLESSYSLG
jgi:hypothetical protein